VPAAKLLAYSPYSHYNFSAFLLVARLLASLERLRKNVSLLFQVLFLKVGFSLRINYLTLDHQRMECSLILAFLFLQYGLTPKNFFDLF
jgi:hypothetical protein